MMMAWREERGVLRNACSPHQAVVEVEREVIVVMVMV
jgi:hypothetical protein